MNKTEVTTLAILMVFYSSFFIKIILLKRRGIDSNLLGKGEKTAQAMCVERILKFVTYTGAAIQFVSALLPGKIWGLPTSGPLQWLGLFLAAAGTAFFIAAMTAMKTNWRSGYDLHQKTSLVASGPYKISRNPAFVGFNLLYIGCSLVYPNIINLLATIFAISAFHRQILEEELFLESAFGEQYQQYRAHVNRYLGKTR
ncbi:isoprenylcysteine carboxylmethyltransferase family protein [Deltaproteobacteria bacterium Smac51]|nr:isoprenylcysteine carboxylmethyltransferase family protein [Deltaproteobacteria bacterium Smac51]